MTTTQKTKVICIATPLYPPEIGGPATYVRELEEGLPKTIRVKVVKFGTVRSYPKGLRHLLYGVLVFWSALGADAILALDPVSVGVPAMWVARILRKPFFVKIVGDYAWEQGAQRFGVDLTLDEFLKIPATDLHPSVQRFRRLQTEVAQHARMIIVPSEYLKRAVVSWGIPADRIQVIYNAVSLGEVGAVPHEVTALSRPLVVSVGRMVPWKEFDGVIDAVSKTDASLVIVGGGALHEEVVAYAKKKLGDRAYFTGSVSHADTLAVIAHADVFVLNSSYEGFSHTLIEALTLGKAVIATNAGGNGEVVDGENGLMIPVHATDLLAQEITRVTTDAQLKASLEQHAAAVRVKFSKERMLAETAQFLESSI